MHTEELSRSGWKNIRYENWLALQAASPQADRVLQNREAFRRQELESETDPVGIFKDYFDGTASLEDAAKKLMTKITLYLQE